MLDRYIGDRKFYGRVMAVAVPIVIQNGISNFVSMLDNIMVGQVGNDPMSGVSIVNGLIFVFNLCIFGVCSGAGIFTAQYHGSNDVKGVTDTFRFKILGCLAITALGVSLFVMGGKPLIGLYLQGEGDPIQAASILGHGMDYLSVMVIGLIPFAISNAYASTLRETGQTVVPMVGGIVAMLVNLVGNYILIFGHFGIRPMGVRGAAVATVISRFVELAIVAGWTHLNGEKARFVVDVFRSFRIPADLLKKILAKGAPLLLNEFLWASGMAVMNQCYSTCGLDVVPAMNISSTLYNLGSVVYLSMGNAVGIIMGQLLGAGKEEAEIRDQDRKLVALSVASGAVFGGLMALASGVFPQIYQTTDGVRGLATSLICISAVMMPFHSYTNAAYFTLRSGGQTVVTFLFDSCFVWVVCVPLAWVLSRMTRIPIVPLYMICQGTELFKCTIGYIMIRRGAWIRDLTR